MSRFLITETSDWELVDRDQDVRGFAALDGTGAPVGRITAMVADTAAHVVSAVVLDTGAEVPVLDITIGDGVVYLSASVPGAATATDPDDHVHHMAFREHHAVRPGVSEYAARDAAYRFGYAAGQSSAHHGQDYVSAEMALRRAYPPGRDFDAEREAVRYGYDLARRGAPGDGGLERS